MKVQPGRDNYYKYEAVKKRLEEELQIEQPARQIANKLRIAVPTFHKYKNLLQLEKGRQYMTSDERTFREKLDATATPSIPPANSVSLKKVTQKSRSVPEIFSHDETNTPLIEEQELRNSISKTSQISVSISKKRK